MQLLQTARVVLPKPLSPQIVTITGRSAGLLTVDKMLIGILLLFNGLTLGRIQCHCQQHAVAKQIWTCEDMDRQLQKQYEDLHARVVAALADRNLAKVARLVALHENTIRSIANGKNKKPAIETLEILADYLFGSR